MAIEWAAVRDEVAGHLRALLRINTVNPVLAEKSIRVALRLCWLPSSSMPSCCGTGWSGRPAVVVVQPAQHRHGLDGR